MTFTTSSYHKNCFMSASEKFSFLSPGRHPRTNTNVRANITNLDILDRHRPNFVTTVKSGVFLEPPREIAALLHLHHRHAPSIERHTMYTFSSKPTLMKSKIPPLTPTKNSRKKRAINDEEKTHYGNTMYDRRIARGSNFAPLSMPKWNPYFGNAKLLTFTEVNKESHTKQEEAKRRAEVRRKAQLKARRLKGGTPPLSEGQKHEIMQTEYLEITHRPPDASIACQVDSISETSWPYVEEKQTQTDHEDLMKMLIDIEQMESILRTVISENFSEIEGATDRELISTIFEGSLREMEKIIRNAGFLSAVIKTQMMNKFKGEKYYSTDSQANIKNIKKESFLDVLMKYLNEYSIENDANDIQSEDAGSGGGVEENNATHQIDDYNKEVSQIIGGGNETEVTMMKDLTHRTKRSLAENQSAPWKSEDVPSRERSLLRTGSLNSLDSFSTEFTFSEDRDVSNAIIAENNIKNEEEKIGESDVHAKKMAQDEIHSETEEARKEDHNFQNGNNAFKNESVLISERQNDDDEEIRVEGEKLEKVTAVGNVRDDTRVVEIEESLMMIPVGENVINDSVESERDLSLNHIENDEILAKGLEGDVNDVKVVEKEKYVEDAINDDTDKHMATVERNGNDPEFERVPTGEHEDEQNTSISGAATAADVEDEKNSVYAKRDTWKQDEQNATEREFAFTGQKNIQNVAESEVYGKRDKQNDAVEERIDARDELNESGEEESAIQDESNAVEDEGIEQNVTEVEDTERNAAENEGSTHNSSEVEGTTKQMETNANSDNSTENTSEGDSDKKQELSMQTDHDKSESSATDSMDTVRAANSAERDGSIKKEEDGKEVDWNSVDVTNEMSASSNDQEIIYKEVGMEEESLDQIIENFEVETNVEKVNVQIGEENYEESLTLVVEEFQIEKIRVVEYEYEMYESKNSSDLDKDDVIVGNGHAHML